MVMYIPQIKGIKTKRGDDQLDSQSPPRDG